MLHAACQPGILLLLVAQSPGVTADRAARRAFAAGRPGPAGAAVTPPGPGASGCPTQAAALQVRTVRFTSLPASELAPSKLEGHRYWQFHGRRRALAGSASQLAGPVFQVASKLPLRARGTWVVAVGLKCDGAEPLTGRRPIVY